jgi:pyruvate dehydrogenase E1 component
MNENYAHPPINPSQEQDVIKGMYLFKENQRAQIRLLGAGAILNEVVQAASILDKFDINSEIWSVTSFNLLRKDGMECDRLRLQDPSDQSIKSFVEDKFSSNNLPVIAASDYVKAYSEQIRPWINGSYYTLGTDGYGRSDSRAKLREFFEVDANAIARSAAYALYQANELSDQQLKDIYKACDHDPVKPHPWEV